MTSAMKQRSYDGEYMCRGLLVNYFVGDSLNVQYFITLLCISQVQWLMPMATIQNPDDIRRLK